MPEGPRQRGALRRTGECVAEWVDDHIDALSGWVWMINCSACGFFVDAGYGRALVNIPSACPHCGGLLPLA